MDLATLFIALHVMANLVWIGAIASVGWLIAAAAKGSEREHRSAAVLARGLYLRVATPAFLTSFLAGLVRLLQAPSYYMHLHWFHGKLAFALGVIALHHVLGARSKRLALAQENPSGSMQEGRSGGILAGALLAFAFLTVVFVIFKQTLVP